MVYSDADTPGGESVVNDNGSDSEILEDSNFNPHKCLNKQPFSGDGSPGDSGETAEQITETTPEDGSNGSGTAMGAMDSCSLASRPLAALPVSAASEVPDKLLTVTGEGNAASKKTVRFEESSTVEKLLDTVTKIEDSVGDVVVCGSPNDPNFWMSNWFPQSFVYEGVLYSCVEQCLTANKACLMKDDDTYTKIMATENPAKMKALGRKVTNYDEAKWAETRTLRTAAIVTNLNAITIFLSTYTLTSSRPSLT